MATRAVRRQTRPDRSPARAPSLRVVKGTKRKPRTSYLPVVVLVVLSVFGVAVLQAWVGQDGLRAASLESEVQKEQERLTLLRAQVAQLSSPQRLRDEANKLGLVPATDPSYLKMPFDPSSEDAPMGAASGMGTLPLDPAEFAPVAP